MSVAYRHCSVEIPMPESVIVDADDVMFLEGGIQLQVLKGDRMAPHFKEQRYFLSLNK